MKLWLKVTAVALYFFLFMGLLLTSLAAWLCCGDVSWYDYIGATGQVIIAVGGLTAGAIWVDKFWLDNL